jgi:hypothetical protein
MAATTLPQLVPCITDRVIKEDHPRLLVSGLESTTLLGEKRDLLAAMRKTLAIFEDLRLLGDSEGLQPANHTSTACFL